MEPQMTQTALVELLRLFENATIAVWLDGGRDVDALLQTQTRPHKDVDRAVRGSPDPAHETDRGSPEASERPNGQRH